MVIAGNHDLCFDPEASAVGTPYRHIIEHPELDKVCLASIIVCKIYLYDFLQAKTMLTNCTYLEDSSATVEGYKVYGSPWQPTYGRGGGAFQLPRDGEEARAVAAEIPGDTDVLLTHGPPHGCQVRSLRMEGPCIVENTK